MSCPKSLFLGHDLQTAMGIALWLQTKNISCYLLLRTIFHHTLTLGAVNIILVGGCCNYLCNSLTTQSILKTSGKTLFCILIKTD